jgi:hypothetical protein
LPADVVASIGSGVIDDNTPFRNNPIRPNFTKNGLVVKKLGLL